MEIAEIVTVEIEMVTEEEPSAYLNILMPISGLKLGDVGGVCNCLSFNKLSLFFF